VESHKFLQYQQEENSMRQAAQLSGGGSGTPEKNRLGEVGQSHNGRENGQGFCPKENGEKKNKDSKSAGGLGRKSRRVVRQVAEKWTRALRNQEIGPGKVRLVLDFLFHGTVIRLRGGPERTFGSSTPAIREERMIDDPYATHRWKGDKNAVSKRASPHASLTKVTTEGKKHGRVRKTTSRHNLREKNLSAQAYRSEGGPRA